MRSLTIMTVVGARPQFVKAEPWARALKATGHRHLLVHTGQHWDDLMSDCFFAEMDLPRPDVNLDVRSGSHGAQTGTMLAGLEGIMSDLRPDWTVVFGDTNSTLAGALCAAKLHIPVAHIEAGLRSWNRRMPEEINRVVTDHLSNLLFAPTNTSVENLLREGIPAAHIHKVGDIMEDAFLRFAGQADASRVLHRLGVERKGYVLATIHRAENTDDRDRMLAIFDGLLRASATLPVVCPLHPRTRKALRDAGFELPGSANLILTDPAGYLDMLCLEANAAVIATDSGGVQKEACFARVPCVTLRAETEWEELIEAGWNRLCPSSSPNEICATVLRAKDAGGIETDLYGGAGTAERILKVIESA